MLANSFQRCQTLLRSCFHARCGFTSAKSLSFCFNSRNTFCSQSTNKDELPERERMDFDVAIVGGGPAGLSTAIRLKQLCKENDTDLDICVIEKGAEIGSHVISGNVFNPRALTELFPNWKELDAPLHTPVTNDQFWLLTETNKIASPYLPPMIRNDGHYIISLGDLCRWMAEQAESMDINIFSGFSASEPIYNPNNTNENNSDKPVIGVATSDLGLNKDGTPGNNYERGVAIHAKQTVLAEGCRGSLSEDIIKNYKLNENSEQQIYAIGFKEVWELGSDFNMPDITSPGTVIHILGYPVPHDLYGGSYIYHTNNNELYIGSVFSLEYSNPYFNPYFEFQKLKKHPILRKIFEYSDKVKCVGYGARALNEGGYQSVPKLTFPGGLLVGCSAGFVNVPKVKGSHYAMKTGIIAAESMYDDLIKLKNDENMCENEMYEVNNINGIECKNYENNVRNSWVMSELKQVRNIKPSFKYGLGMGMLHSGITTMITKGNEPWTLSNGNKLCCDYTKPKNECKEIEYEKPDGKITFDILTSVSRTNTYHEDSEPSHLKIKPELSDMADNKSWEVYGGPESRFCPAKVYEYIENPESKKMELVINSQNCIHCKTCSIKTPKEFIKWTVPQGGGGPKYGSM